eukprot:scaffold48932_cov46-Phaeocystis_antarctica.AAC.2
MSDSYLGGDQEYELKLSVGEARATTRRARRRRRRATTSEGRGSEGRGLRRQGGRVWAVVAVDRQPPLARPVPGSAAGGPGIRRPCIKMPFSYIARAIYTGPTPLDRGSGPRGATPGDSAAPRPHPALRLAWVL